MRRPADTLPAKALVGTALVLALFVLAVPLVSIFAQALSRGFEVYAQNILHPATLHAIRLTVLTAIVVVPINAAFGIAVAWLVTRHRFPGRKLLLTIIEIPFSVSPIVAGVIYLFLYGAQGLFGPALQAAGVQVMFTVWAIFLVSLFVTAPFVARELIPLMEAQGSGDEEAALSLGASGLSTFLLVTLPNIRYALLYGLVLTNARAMGEFGAVSVVSGNIRGQTNTLPLQVDLLFNDFNVVGAFAAASTLALIALATLLAKVAIEHAQGSHQGASR